MTISGFASFTTDRSISDESSPVTAPTPGRNAHISKSPVFSKSALSLFLRCLVTRTFFTLSGPIQSGVIFSFPSPQTSTLSILSVSPRQTERISFAQTSQREENSSNPRFITSGKETVTYFPFLRPISRSPFSFITSITLIPAIPSVLSEYFIPSISPLWVLEYLSITASLASTARSVTALNI